MRQAQLKILVEGSEAALELALAQADEPEVRYLGWMITKILGDDVETNGSGELQIAEDTAADRIIRLGDCRIKPGPSRHEERKIFAVPTPHPGLLQPVTANHYLEAYKAIESSGGRYMNIMIDL